MVYLLEQLFQGDVYAVNGMVGRLVTLGTPYHTHERFAKIKTDFIFSHLTPELNQTIQTRVDAEYERLLKLEGLTAEAETQEAPKEAKAEEPG